MVGNPWHGSDTSASTPRVVVIVGYGGTHGDAIRDAMVRLRDLERSVLVDPWPDARARRLREAERDLGVFADEWRRGSGRLMHAADITPPPKRFHAREAAAPSKGVRCRPGTLGAAPHALSRRDRWPGVRKRRRPTATFLARHCPWRRA